MTYAANLEQLRSTVDMLQKAYDRALAETNYRPDDALMMRTADGRFIYLDALTALVQAQTVLVQAEAVQR